MNTKHTLLLLLVSFLWFSCGDKKEKDPKQETSNEADVVDFEMPSVIDNNVDYKMFKKVEPYLNEIKQKYDSVPYFFVIDTNYYFYVVKGGWTDPSADTLDGEAKFKVGVVDKFNKTIIPVEYNKIYNPSGTAVNYIEVEKEGKRGLFHISGKQITPALYDYIYPSPVKTSVAQVRLGGRFGLLAANGEVDFDGEGLGSQSPYFSKAAEKWNFNVRNESIVFFQSTESFFYDDAIFGRAMVITPPYLQELNLMPSCLKSITTQKNADFGLVDSETGIGEVKNWWDNIKAIFAWYYEEGLAARGHKTIEESIHTIDEKGDKVDEIRYNKPFYSIGVVGCNAEDANNMKIAIKNDTIIEVKQYKVSDQEKLSLPYDFHPYYIYFIITRSGKFEKLKTNRRYIFTKYVKIDESYFKGCFGQITNNPTERGEEVMRSEHLSLDELEVMKNEIFADYGLIFKTDKWKNYFSSQTWYIGQYDDVNDKLSDIDSHNIKVIINTINKMKEDPDGYIKKTKSTIWAAG